MKRFDHEEGYRYYDEIGLGMNIVKSEVFPMFASKGLPMHMYCADTEEDVRLCIEKGAALITANDPVPLLKILNEE
jgi:glycerophosphoryl diester phosphodiesterase